MNLRAVFRRRSTASDHTVLSAPQTNLLLALLSGDTLKSHRYLDGGKEYRLHPLNGEATPVEPQVVRSLEDNGCLLSNQKFPAATLILSDRGRRAAQTAQDAAESHSKSKVLADTYR